MEAIQKNIKKLRNIKGLSQSEFAKLFDLSRANIGSYEEGRAQPKIETATRIANYFSISLDDFVNRELSVNELSGFNELKENELHNWYSSKNSFANIPFVNQEEFKRFVSLGKSSEYISIPASHNADLALLHSGHHLEGIDGIFDGDILLLEKIKKTEVQHGLIHVFLQNNAPIVGICFMSSSTIELRGILKEVKIAEMDLDSIRKVWRLKGVISTKARNFEYTWLNNRVSELEEMMKKVLAGAAATRKDSSSS
jgi:transcriptional regulator with XRE-family HTH domain